MIFRNRFILRIKGVLKNTTIRHGVLYTIFAFINNGISFFLLLLLAKFLSPSEYGKLNLFTSIINILSIIIALSTTSYIPIAFFQKSRHIFSQIIVIVLIISTCTLGVLFVIFSMWNNVFEYLAGLQIKYLLIASLICYFQVLNNTNLDIWRLEEKPVYYGIYSLSYAALNFVISILLVVTFNYGWEGRVYSWLFLATCYFVVSLVFLSKRGYFKFVKPTKIVLLETLAYGFPIVIHLLSSWFRQGMDRFIINHYYDSAEVGVYSFALNLASIISIVGTAFNSTNSVHIFKNLSNNYISFIAYFQQKSRIMVVIFVVFGIIVTGLAYLIITIFLPKYRDSLFYLSPLCIGAVFQCIYLLWVNFLFFYKKTKKLMYISILAASIQFPLSFILTRYSCFITSIISMIVSIVTAILVFMIANNLIKNHWAIMAQ